MHGPAQRALTRLTPKPTEWLMALLRILPLLVLTSALGACGGLDDITGQSALRVSAPPPPRPAAGLRPAPTLAVPPGLEGVIGADAEQLVRLFGTARIDVREADARKLQWSGTACILDAYLYPPSRGGRATTSWVDARRGDGRDVDKAACIAALRRLPPPVAAAPATPSAPPQSGAPAGPRT